MTAVPIPILVPAVPRVLRLALALSCALLAVPAGASAQFPLPASCGGATGAPPADTAGTSNFDVRQEDPLTPPADGLTKDDYKAALQASYTKLVTTYGWAPPPTGDRILVVIGGTTSQTVTTTAGGNNPNTAWPDEDAKSACIVVPEDFGAPDNASAKRALQGTAAREVTKLLLHGIGALTGANAPDPVFAEGGPAMMEDEVFPEADTEIPALYPDFEDSLGAYDGAPRSQWFALRGLSERFGRGAAGGAEQLLQDFFEATSNAGPGNLTSLDDALKRRGPSLGEAFHEYALAAQAVRPCGSSDVLPRCFAEAAKFRAAKGVPAPHRTIASGPGQLEAAIEDNYAAQFVGLPAGPFDLVVSNMSTGGLVRATAVCTSGQTVLRLALEPMAAGQSRTLPAFPPAGCTGPALVLTSSLHQVANPSTSTARPYRVTLLAPTGELSVAIAGPQFGGVVSDPAGIACGADCAERYPVGSDVKLAALIAPGARFVSWGGACAGVEGVLCTVKMEVLTSVTATFETIPPVATTTPAPGAQPTPAPGLPSFEAPRPTGDTTAPVVRLDRFKRSGRKLTLRVSCPAAETGGCTGFITLAARALGKNLKLGEQAFVALEGGTSDTLEYALTKRSRAVLDRVKRVTVRATGRSRDAAFNAARISKSFVLKRAR